MDGIASSLFWILQEQDIENGDLFLPADTPIANVNPIRLHNLMKKRHANERKRLLNAQAQELAEYQDKFSREKKDDLFITPNIVFIQNVSSADFLTDNASEIADIITIKPNQYNNHPRTASVDETFVKENDEIKDRQKKFQDLLKSDYKEGIVILNQRHEAQFKLLAEYQKEDLARLPQEIFGKSKKEMSPVKDKKETSPVKDDMEIDSESTSSQKRRRMEDNTGAKNKKPNFKNSLLSIQKSNSKNQSSSPVSSPTTPTRPLPPKSSPPKSSPPRTSPPRTSPPRPLPARPLSPSTLPTRPSPPSTLPTRPSPPRTLPTRTLPSRPANNSTNTLPSTSNKQQQKATAPNAGSSIPVKDNEPARNKKPVPLSKNKNMKTSLLKKPNDNSKSVAISVPGRGPTPIIAPSNTDNSNASNMPLFTSNGDSRGRFNRSQGAYQKVLSMIDKGAIVIRSKPNRVLIKGINYGDPKDFDDAINGVQNPSNPITKRYMQGDYYLFHSSEENGVVNLGPVSKIQPLIQKFFLSM